MHKRETVQPQSNEQLVLLCLCGSKSLWPWPQTPTSVGKKDSKDHVCGAAYEAISLPPTVAQTKYTGSSWTRRKDCHSAPRRRCRTSAVRS